MFKAKTVFIVGAGASKEFGLPVASDLRVTLKNMLNIRYSDLINPHETGHPLILRQIGRDASLINDTRRIASSLERHPSIDQVLDIHSDLVSAAEIAKMAIATEIHASETRSSLFKQNDEGYFESLRETWLSKLFTMASSGSRGKEKPAEIFQNISFVIFNYDRCIEHYLEQALQAEFDLHIQQCREIVSKIPMLHIYGSLGSLDEVQFGESQTRSFNYYEMGKRITTFSSVHYLDEKTAALRRILGSADQLIFLGFSFGEQNFQLLKECGPKEKISRIYATTIGLKEDFKNQIEVRLKGMAFEAPIRDMTCFDLLDEFEERLQHKLR